MKYQKLTEEQLHEILHNGEGSISEHTSVEIAFRTMLAVQAIARSLSELTSVQKSNADTGPK